MRTQLRLFLARFNEALVQYSLARLEAALRNPGAPGAPLVQRLGASGSVRSAGAWTLMSRRVDAVSRYANSVRKGTIALPDEVSRAALLASARRVIVLRNSIEKLHRTRGKGGATR